MKKLIRAFSRFWLKLFYPNLYLIEDKDYNVGMLGKSVANSIISTKSKISSPAAIGNSEIGDYTYISFNSRIGLTKIGKFCSIGPNLFCGWGIHPSDGIATSPIFYSTNKIFDISFSANDKIEERKTIVIGNDVFIGMNVTVLDGIKIGNGAIIGAGAVVSKDIPAYAIAVGSPIQVIKYRFTPQQIEKLEQLKWWDFEFDQLKTVEKHFFDIDAFIQQHSQNESN